MLTSSMPHCVYFLRQQPHSIQGLIIAPGEDAVDLAREIPAQFWQEAREEARKHETSQRPALFNYLGQGCLWITVIVLFFPLKWTGMHVYVYPWFEISFRKIKQFSLIPTKIFYCCPTCGLQTLANRPLIITGDERKRKSSLCIYKRTNKCQSTFF